MGGVAVGAAGDLFREAETIVLAVVAVQVGLDRDGKDIVALHHLFVGMAFHADFGVEFAVLVGFRVTERLDCMEVMAVVAGGRILVAGRYRLAVDGIPVDRLLVMALDALGDDHPLVVFPVFVRMDIGMAIGAPDVRLGMHAGEMFAGLLFMAALAMDLLDLDLAFHMFGEVGDLDVATGAGILAVNRCGKGGNGNLVAVATETGSRIDGHPLFSRSRHDSGEENQQRMGIKRETNDNMHSS